MEFKEISDTIIALKHKDLKLRDVLIKQQKFNEGYHKEMERLHLKNAEVLDKIITEIGYPTIAKVGEEASDAAWLIIQHAISKPNFMRKCLQLLEIAVKNKEADAKNFAYLSDRIAFFENKPQKYGTQFNWDNQGKLSPNIFDNLEKVNQRRCALGLNSLEKQIEIMRERAKLENQIAPKDFVQYQKDFEIWKLKTGWIF
ncbi:DUF6624 domain-containing protein [uncultured Polaribacter sp.]|uniref:DUF6624 domain-containing protein n=1 Tax=uncultured Polaribacter sp. TaxID=174711 RepID=UPI00261814D9|nr:DUF6624 domain-containing protein [uncultured Polaribacter sp.]